MNKAERKDSFLRDVYQFRRQADERGFDLWFSSHSTIHVKIFSGRETVVEWWPVSCTIYSRKYGKGKASGFADVLDFASNPMPMGKIGRREGDACCVTRQILDAGRSFNGGWSRRQIELLGVPWPVAYGWQNEVLGKVITATAKKRFLDFKDKHLQPRQNQLSPIDAEYREEVGRTVYTAVVESPKTVPHEVPEWDREPPFIPGQFHYQPSR